MIATGDDIARFVCEGLDTGFVPPFTAMGIKRDGNIVGGVVFNVFEGADVHISVYGKGWTPDFMRAVGDYVYRQLGCERMTVVTQLQPVIALACKLGGMVEGCMRNHYGPGKDGVIIGILRDEYRYGKKRAGRCLSPVQNMQLEQ